MTKTKHRCTVDSTEIASFSTYLHFYPFLKYLYVLLINTNNDLVRVHHFVFNLYCIEGPHIRNFHSPENKSVNRRNKKQ